MMVQKHFEEKLMRRVARSAACIRVYGRFPATLDAVWPTLAAFALFGGFELMFWLVSWWDRGHIANLVVAIAAFCSVAVFNIRALFFNRIFTGRPLGDGVQAFQVALAAAGFSLEWTEGRDAAILFARPGRGGSHERHAVVFVPADGHIWYNVYDTRGSRFFVADRRPLRGLIQQVEHALGLEPSKQA